MGVGADEGSVPESGFDFRSSGLDVSTSWERRRDNWGPEITEQHEYIAECFLGKYPAAAGDIDGQWAVRV